MTCRHGHNPPDPDNCALCNWIAGAPERAARRYAPVPRDVPELGDEFDKTGSGGMYDDGWKRREHYEPRPWSRHR